MAKNDNLKDFLTDVADAIREKKGTTDLINPQDFSSEIASIESGGDIWGFDTIGYTTENIPIAEWVAHAEDQKRRYESDEIKNFKNDLNLHFVPILDISKKQSLSQIFSGCKYLMTAILKTTPFTTAIDGVFQSCKALVYADIGDTSKCTTFGYLFSGCVSLKYLKGFNPVSAVYLQYCFGGCEGLPYLGELDTQNVTNFSGFTNACWSLTRIESIDLSSATNLTSAFSAAVTFIKIKNLGKSSIPTFNFSSLTKWGVATDDIPDARQSLVDSLITYSYDRASNGMPTATIQLSANTKALLTEEEIAQITNKGFTIA